jgi:hypothetical protein
MARAGFYTVESGKISFRHDGHWYSDDERIENPRIALLFSQSIRRNPDGSYFLQVAEERAPISVEDTAYVVTTIEEDGHGGFVIATNDDVREALDAYRARFLRTAYYHLAEHFVSDDGKTFSLVIGGCRYRIRELEKDPGSNGGPTQTPSSSRN